MDEDKKVLACRFCGRPCKSAGGLRSHEGACKQNPAPGLAAAEAEGKLAEAAKAEAAKLAPAAKKVPQKNDRWPGLCPKCESKLEVYARTCSTGLGKRTKYIRCAARCGWKTTSTESIEGPQPIPPERKKTRPDPVSAG